MGFGAVNPATGAIFPAPETGTPAPKDGTHSPQAAVRPRAGFPAPGAGLLPRGVVNPTTGGRETAELKGARKTLTDPAGNLRFRIEFGPKPGPNQAQNIQHATHKPAHNDSERF